MTFTDVTIRDSHADDDMRARVVDAANDFAAKHGLTDDEVRAIHADSDHPLFWELDTAMTSAAIEGFADQTYIIGEISNLR